MPRTRLGRHHRPDRRSARQGAGRGLARTPAVQRRLVLPGVVRVARDGVRLHPDDRLMRVQPHRPPGALDLGAAPFGVPLVDGDAGGGHRERGRQERRVEVRDRRLARIAIPARKRRAGGGPAPGVIRAVVVDEVRRVGGDERGTFRAHELAHQRRIGRVSAEQTVGAEDPAVAGPRARRRRHRQVVRVRRTVPLPAQAGARRHALQQPLDGPIPVGDRRQRSLQGVRIGARQAADRIQRGEDRRLFGLVQIHVDHRDRGLAALERQQAAQVPVHDVAAAPIDHHALHPADIVQDAGQGLLLEARMQAPVVRVLHDRRGIDLRVPDDPVAPLARMRTAWMEMLGRHAVPPPPWAADAGIGGGVPLLRRRAAI